MLTHFLDLLAVVISVTSLLIVTYGALIGIISFLKNEIRRFTGGYSITNIRKLRATFGTYLLLGLEFLIASDILKTVLEPTLNELALLGGIVVLRTILSVFLNKEIKNWKVKKIKRAANGTRTRDPQLGKLMLYQLSYCRISKTGTKVIYIFQLTKYKQTIFTIIIKISALLFISTALCISCVWISRSLSPIKGL